MKVTEEIDDLVKYINKLQNTEKLLIEAYDVIMWMSGASDFQPKGKANNHWYLIREKISDKIRNYNIRYVPKNNFMDIIDDEEIL